jgi:protocatechuate 3,4-dioxygenase beta subunit
VQGADVRFASLFVSIGFLMFAPLVSARQECGCARVERPCSAYWADAAVFVGRVESVTREAGTRRVRLAVVESFRGVSASTVDVLTGPAGQRCSLPFKPGREYLVYASHSAPAGDLTATACSRTRGIEDAGADLAYARAIKDGAPVPGRITGQVLLGRRDIDGRALRMAEPIANVNVRLTKDDGADVVTTNQAGDFAIEARSAGNYTVRVDVPDGYYADHPSSTVELRDARGCADVRTTLYPNGVIAGRVIDPSGRPIAGLTIEIATATLRQRRKTITDRDGRYEMTRLPPGRFVVGTNAVSASRVTLAAGQRVALGDFRIPAHIKYVSVSGFVLDVDGTPAEGARVYVRGIAEGDHIVAEPATVDFLGRFVIAVLAGADYQIFAERSRPPRTDSTEPVHVIATEGLKPLRLVLRRRY